MSFYLNRNENLNKNNRCGGFGTSESINFAMYRRDKMSLTWSYTLFILIIICACFVAMQIKTAVVFTLDSSAGFFSVFFMMCKAYLYAKTNKYDFYIDHDNWQYTYNEGWHDYFKSLRVWTPDIKSKYSIIKKFNHGNCDRLQQHSIHSYISVIHELFALNDVIQTMAQTFIKNNIKSDYVSLYIRRGDKTNGKFKEMDEWSTDEIVQNTIQRQISKTKTNLFVQTDDYSVIEDLQSMMPFTNIFTFTKKEERGSKNGNMLTWSSQQRKSETENLLASILVFRQGNHCWSDHRSNVGRFHKLFAYNKTSLYPIFKDNAKHTNIDPSHGMRKVPGFFLYPCMS